MTTCEMGLLSVKLFTKLFVSVSLSVATLVMQNGSAFANSTGSTMYNLTDVASKASITFIQPTGTPDPVFAKLQGKYQPAGNSLSNPAKWAGFLRQGGRNITFHLGSQTYISSVSLSFEVDAQKGIHWPSYIHVLTSPDAHTWYLLNSGQDTVTKNNNIETISVSSPTPVTANYIKIIFPVIGWAFAGQLHIWASPIPGFQQQPAPIVTPGKSTSNIGYLPATSLGNAHHILLVYTGANGQLGHWSAQDYLPMLNYIDQNGIAESPMFDTMLYLPYNDAGDTAQGWTNYLKDLFAPNGEIANLETATNEAGLQMAQPRRITNVILSLPYASPSQHNFGPITSGGPSLNFNPNFDHLGENQSLLNREAATKWYFDQLMTDWNQSTHPNLNLVGIYWDEENIPVGADDPHVVQYMHQLTATANLPLLWIPFYGANGVSNWSSLGFDAALLQSNYYETQSATTARINSTAQIAQQYGLGLELEVQAGALTNPTQSERYSKELSAFALQLPVGSDAVEAFYDGSKVLLHAYQSHNALARSLYDTTGLWLKVH